MIRENLYLVVRADKKGRAVIAFDSTLRHEAQAYAAEHGGFIIKTERLVDEFAQESKEPRFRGPIHEHVGPVPPMLALPPAAPEPPRVIRMNYGEFFPAAHAPNEGWLGGVGTDDLELIDERDDPTKLDLSPRLFADIMQALQMAEDGES